MQRKHGLKYCGYDSCHGDKCRSEARKVSYAIFFKISKIILLFGYRILIRLLSVAKEVAENLKTKLIQIDNRNLEISTAKLNTFHLSAMKNEEYLDSQSLGSKIALTEERVKHLHPEIFEHELEFFDTIQNGEKLKKPNHEVILYKWYDTIKKGKYMVVVVINRDTKRPFIVTAMICRNMPRGEKYE